MNAADVLTYGHQTVIDAAESLEDEQWLLPGVCGVWSAKDVIAHLVSYEWLLTEILQGVLAKVPTPHLDEFTAPGGEFNDRQVAIRAEKSAADLLSEFAAAHAEVMMLMSKIPPARLGQVGLLPWYGDQYALDDLIVYMYYGHAREHSAQIEAFRDRAAG